MLEGVEQTVEVDDKPVHKRVVGFVVGKLLLKEREINLMIACLLTMKTNSGLNPAE